MSRKACAVLVSSAEVVINVRLTANCYNQFCKGTVPIPVSLAVDETNLLQALGFASVGFASLIIVLRVQAIPFTQSRNDNSDCMWQLLFIFQNRDMEPQHHRVIDCNWHMVGFPRVEYTGCVSHPHAFSLSSHTLGLYCKDLTLVRGFTHVLVL